MLESQFQEHPELGDDFWGVHDIYHTADWAYEVHDDLTRLGYWDWVLVQIEQAQAEDDADFAAKRGRHSIASALTTYMQTFEVYDPAYHTLSVADDLAACEVLEAAAEKAPDTRDTPKALVKLFLYLWIWHGEKPTADRMAKAIDELADSDVPLIADKMEFGSTTKIGSHLWDETCTCEYWDGDKYATPHGAVADGKLVYSQAQGAGVFSRDAMCDAIAVAKLFGGRIAVSACR